MLALEIHPRDEFEVPNLTILPPVYTSEFGNRSSLNYVSSILQLRTLARIVNLTFGKGR